MSNMGYEINNAEVVNGKCLSTKTIFKPITAVPVFKTICLKYFSSNSKIVFNTGFLSELAIYETYNISSGNNFE